jgi:hypothetical protein
MKVYTDLIILKKVWKLLKEIGLQGLLDGDKIDVDISKVLDWLLVQGKLDQFCKLVTKSEEDFENKDLSEVVKVVADFFENIGEAFQQLPSVVKVIQAKEG